jgi:hypothetical protein
MSGAAAVAAKPASAAARYLTGEFWCMNCGHRERIRLRVPPGKAHHALFFRQRIRAAQCRCCIERTRLASCRCPLCRDATR